VKELMLTRWSVRRLKKTPDDDSPSFDKTNKAHEDSDDAADSDDFITSVDQLEKWNQRLITDKAYKKKKVSKV